LATPSYAERSRLGGIPTRRGVALGLLRAARPRQWAKNVLVAAAPAAAGILLDVDVLVTVALAFVALSAVASGTYLLNDVADREEDRAHPRKRLRPIASGVVAPRSAVLAGVALIAAGLAVAAVVTPGFLAACAAYLAITAAYTLRLRRVAVVDLLTIAGLFALRVVAGGFAVDVPLSRWFVAVTIAGALFVVVGKRHGERCLLLEDGERRRSSLSAYSGRGLVLLGGAAALCALAAYTGWALQAPDGTSPVPWHELSVLPFAGVLGRYGALAARGRAGAPEDVVLGDRAFLALALVWLVTFSAGVAAGT
jgi:decaprenyl-phosphate phosphoribosyltransferase